MNGLLVAPLVVPLAAAAAALLAHGHRTAQRAIAFTATTAVLVTGVALLVAVHDGTVLAVLVGGFEPPVPITLAADGLTALFVAVTGVVGLACLAFAASAGADDHRLFHPLVQVLFAGIGLSFTTADLFNLFVAFEVMLIASYVLSVLDSGRPGRSATFTYVAVNLTASTLLLAGVGLTYALAGTVNLGLLATVAADVPALAIPAALLFVAFAIKAGLVPVHGWISRTYPDISPAVAALFSGLLTKVGVYALYRTATLLFPGDRGLAVVLAVVAGITMFVGVVNAVGQSTLRHILSFHITSQIGYMIMGLALGGLAGLAGGIAYTMHHIVVKTSLFLSAGAAETSFGSGRLDRLGGIVRTRPVQGIAFGLAAASLAGLPPLSGFVPKLMLLQAAFGQGAWLLGGVSLLVSLLTLVSMLKIWHGAYWGRPDRVQAGDERLIVVPAGASPDHDRRSVDEPPVTPAPAVGPRRQRRLAGPALALTAVAVALGVAPGVLVDVSQAAAAQLVDTSAYVDAVLGRSR